RVRGNELLFCADLRVHLCRLERRLFRLERVGCRLECCLCRPEIGLCRLEILVLRPTGLNLAKIAATPATPLHFSFVFHGSYLDTITYGDYPAPEKSSD